jgi:hypothetical protein
LLLFVHRCVGAFDRRLDRRICLTAATIPSATSRSNVKSPLADRSCPRASLSIQASSTWLTRAKVTAAATPRVLPSPRPRPLRQVLLDTDHDHELRRQERRGRDRKRQARVEIWFAGVCAAKSWANAPAPSTAAENDHGT